ncbi:MAG TPA: hypothetical protein VHE37_15005, partial [Nevskiaceae bacterium]|nr:hypothetical protein [Nevskiaceae bacterium]
MALQAGLLRGGLVMVATLALCSCNFPFSDDSGSGSSTTPGSGVDISGTALLGPLNGATLRLFPVTPTGGNGAPSVTAEAGPTPGSFKFHLDQVPSGPFRVCAEGGTYTDEASGNTGVQNKLSELCATVPSNSRTVNVNVLTALANSLLKGLMSRPSPPPLVDALITARNTIQTFANLTAPPDEVTPVFHPSDSTDPNGDDLKAGLIIGGYSQLDNRDAATCPPPSDAPQQQTGALIADIADGVFDGKDGGTPIQVTCNNTPQNMPVGRGTAELSTALTEFVNQQPAEDQQADNQTASDIKVSVTNGDTAPPQVKVTPSQGLISIDQVNNIAYVPIYTFDANGNARIAVVDLKNPPADPANIPTVALVDANDPDANHQAKQPVATSFDPVGRLVYVEARRADNGVNVYVIDPSNNSVVNVVQTGLTHNGTFGGIIADPQNHQVVVTGTSSLSLLDISATPAVLKTDPNNSGNSVFSINGTDSIALNFDTQKLFVSADGSNQIIDLSIFPPVQHGFSFAPNTADGVGFDNLTGLVVLSAEVTSDEVYVYNFVELASDQSTAPMTR